MRVVLGASSINWLHMEKIGTSRYRKKTTISYNFPVCKDYKDYKYLVPQGVPPSNPNFHTNTLPVSQAKKRLT